MGQAGSRRNTLSSEPGWRAEMEGGRQSDPSLSAAQSGSSNLTPWWVTRGIKVSCPKGHTKTQESVFQLDDFIGDAGRTGPGQDMDSVGCQDLLDPGNEGCDSGIHRWSGGGADATAPGHDASQGPGSVLLADQGATRVTLKGKTVGLSSSLIRVPGPSRTQRRLQANPQGH